MKRIAVGSSKIHKKGMLADEPIKKGELITFVKGKIHYLHVETRKQSLTHPNWIGISQYTWIDPKVPCKYLNHSCNANSGIRGSVGLYALRDIQKGVEVTIDYGTIEANILWEMKCECGEENCRKIIRSIQSLPRPVYASYMPYIPTYFQKLYAHVHSTAQYRRMK